MTYYLNYKGISEEEITLFKNIASLVLNEDLTHLKTESVIVRAFLCFVMKEYYGQDTVNLKKSESGKPYLSSCDHKISLSHSGECVLLSVSDVEIGCDVELVSQYREAVAKRFFSLKEAEFLKNTENKDEAFIRLWTLKESVLKKFGAGLSGGLSVYDFSDVVYNDSFYKYGMYFVSKVYFPYVISVCSEKAGEEFKNISFKNLLKQFHSYK